MKFSFQKYIKKVGLLYLLEACFIGLVLIDFSDDFSVFLIFMILLLVIVGDIIFRFHKKHSMMKQFLDDKSEEEIEKIELEISNCLLKYKNWYLTDTYLFNLDKFVIIPYEEIVLVESSFTYKITNRGGLTKKATIYLKDGRKYSYEIGINGSTHKLEQVIQSKNFNVFIGSKSKYKKEIKEKFDIDI